MLFITMDASRHLFVYLNFPRVNVSVGIIVSFFTPHYFCYSQLLYFLERKDHYSQEKNIDFYCFMNFFQASFILFYSCTKFQILFYFLFVISYDN